MQNPTNPEAAETERLAYSPAQAAAAVGVNRSRIYSEIAAGRLAKRKVGGRALILVDDLRAWLNALPSI